MSSSQTDFFCLVETYLSNKVWQYLDAGLYSTARFTAERLLAFDLRNNNYRHLIALVCYRMGEFYTALGYAQHVPHLGCLFVYAQCCLRLRKYQLGIAALENGSFLYKKTTMIEEPIEIETCQLGFVSPRVVIPHTPMVLTLLASLYKAAGMDKKAVISYALALKLDPFCWEAVAGLCELQIPIDTEKLYKNLACLFKSMEEADTNDKNPKIQKASRPKSLPSAIPSSNDLNKIQSSFLPQVENSSQSFEISEESSISKRSNNCSSDNNLTCFHASYSSTKNRSSADQFTHLQRQSRVSKISPSSSLHKSTKKVPHIKQNDLQKFTTLSKHDIYFQKATEFLSSLYMKLAVSYGHYCSYRCDECIATLHQLPAEQVDTPWVTARLARMYFEKVDYSTALHCFTRLREIDPYRLEDMEYYSTLLWHLRNGPALNHLANALVAQNRAAPQVWCSVGNALSLAHDTEGAICAFRRASALCPNAAYPYTLEAHEHVTADAYEHAKACYRQALRADKRHYNAWYGLGVVFLRMGELQMAKMHFVTASRINPSNVVVSCCIGLVEERLGKFESSLACYSNAISKHPKSAISLYKRARLLIKMKRYEEAMMDLNVLSNLAPDEASVHFLKGQILKMMKKRSEAVHELTVALTLDPKGAHLIKKALEDLKTIDE